MPLTYYIPDWDDRVDPEYNFTTDVHQPGRNPYQDDHYAHQIYEQPPYDGILVSRSMLDANRQKHDLVEQNGIREYLRAPDGMAILGDSGAFSYWQLAEPPYTTHEMLEYYRRFGFTYGVSIDHLIFTEIEGQRHERLLITQRNAEAFFEEHRRGGYGRFFTPIGAAQGWNEESYAQSVERLIEVGYRYIALGGLVRSPASFILSVLERIQPIIQNIPELRVHLFGVTRVEHVAKFHRLGVTSFDSASRLRRAWMDGRKNYFLHDESYTAIRIPFAAAVAKKHDVDAALAAQREQAALALVRAADQNPTMIDAALDAIVAYAELFRRPTERDLQEYHRTLAGRPWRQCDCEICRNIGVEVVIFRGNNRNRRRGFHNTWQLYQDLQAMRDMTMSLEIIRQERMML